MRLINSIVSMACSLTNDKIGPILDLLNGHSIQFILGNCDHLCYSKIEAYIEFMQIEELCYDSYSSRSVLLATNRSKYNEIIACLIAQKRG